MPKPTRPIAPHLWFDKEAVEAAEFYCSVFPHSEITKVSTVRDTPSGDCDLVSFELAGHPFVAISAGPFFTFNPSISFFVNFDASRDADAREKLDATWEKLSQGGTALMPLDTYPFSERFGWVQDRYGLSWQLILSNLEGDERPNLVPSLLFVGEVCGRAEEAIDFYTSVFSDSGRGNVVRYGADHAPDKEGTIMFADVTLSGQWFAAMDSAHEHHFAFNEAISFMVYCDTQEEIDYYWNALSDGGEEGQCGWLKDRFGVSWQVAPTVLEDYMSDSDPEATQRVTQAFLQMKKFDIEALRKAYAGKQA